MNIVVFDIETQNLFEDVGGRDNIGALKVSCAVSWSSVRNDFSVYWEKDVPALIAELKSAGRVIGFNVKGFDYEVLRPYAPDERLQSLPTLDIMDDLFRTLSFRVSLDAVARATLGETKSATGLQAVARRRVGQAGRILQGGCGRDPPNLRIRLREWFCPVLQPPGEQTESAGEMEMLKTTLNGLELAYERRGSGTPLVLLHGYPLDYSIWNLVVPLLENDFDLILPDLRGFGQSGILQARYLLTDMAADMAALLDALKIEQAVIAGHSMGGYVALACARRHPGRVRGLGLVASQAIADPPEKKAGRYQMAERVEANGVGEVAESMPAMLTADAGLQTTLKKLILRQSPEGVAGALRAIAERPDSTDILPSFNFPVAIIHGLADKIIPIERAREVQAMVKGSHLVEIEGTGHMPMMEAPQATAEALKTLL